jgi:hypothetical protein
MSRFRIPVLAALIACVSLLGAAAAQAEESVEIKAKFTPNKLGAPTNVSGEGEFHTNTGKVPTPLTHIVIAGPAGLGLNTKGTGTCDPKKLATVGPKACPKNSVAGAGGGLGVFELAGSEIQEPFELNLFRGPNRNGKFLLLIYVNAESPVSVQLVFEAPVITLPKPYGLGFAFEVPLIPTLPEASDASVRNAHISIGATKVSYVVKGKRVKVKGIIEPKKCPKGGFPIKSEFSFQDGTTVAPMTTIPCPKSRHKRRHRR